jgi:acyl dehydratase
MTHPYARTISAFNTATESDNKIHDDATASRFGFTGGLVPGVDVFAYMAHGPVKLWGRDWLSEGGMRARFVKPVYDGEQASLKATAEGEDHLKLQLTSRGELCGDGHADRKASQVRIEIPPAALQPEASERPRASMQSLVVGQVLGYRPEPYTQELGLEHLDMVREEKALYDDGRIASPGYLLRRANYILASNVKLGPWIHSESDIRLHGLMQHGDTLETRARVAENFERKGHLTVSLDFAILASGKLAMSGRHWAIYEPRQVRTA